MPYVPDSYMEFETWNLKLNIIPPQQDGIWNLKI